MTEKARTKPKTSKKDAETKRLFLAFINQDLKGEKRKHQKMKTKEERIFTFIKRRKLLLLSHYKTENMTIIKTLDKKTNRRYEFIY